MIELCVPHCPTWLRAGVLLGAFVSSVLAANNYLVHNLVADQPGVADKVDKNLVNPWGNGFSGASPFWVGNNGTGTSTLYDTTGTALALVVTVPAAAGASTPGPVTGVISNGNPTAFNVAAGKAASFLFCTEDGTISGWNSTADATNAKILVDNSKSGAVYKGCTLGGTSTAPLLYAANFNSGKIDVWDANFAAVQNAAAFVNPAVPTGFAPFNIQNMGGKLYVAYAKQDNQKHDDEAGIGNGYIATFDMSGTLLGNLAAKGALNSPWGMAIAPASFGDFANALLVGNFGDGMILGFNLNTGAPVGAGILNDLKGAPIAILGLWSLNFGNGGRGGDKATLYFTAGTGQPLETHGLFGSIQAAPSYDTIGILNGASFSTTIAPNSWVSIKGGGLSATTRSWQTKDFTGNKLPTQLDNVGVMVNGEAAYVSYISPAQINFLVPGDIVSGPARIQTTNNGLTSATLSSTMQATAPSLFIIGTSPGTTNQAVAATHADNSLIGPPSLITGVTTTSAKAGETIVLYGNGFGPTTPAVPLGQTITTALPLSAAPVVTIGGLPATVAFAGLVAPGLYQLNVVVPTGLKATGTAANTDFPVVVQVSGTQTQTNAFLSIATP